MCMRIGIFTDTYAPQINGVVTSIESSLNYLNQNHTVYIFCPNVKPKVKSTKHIWRFPSVVYPFQKEYRLVLPFNKQLDKIKELQLDIIHVHTPFTMGIIGLKIAKKLNIPAIHTFHTYFEKYLHYFPILPEKWMNKYAKKETEKICNQCKLIIVPTEEMRNELKKYNINSPSVIIPSGIKNEKISEKDIKDFKTKNKLKDEIYCLFVGRIGHEKNIYFLLNAFEKIQQQIPNINLLIIGDGPERKNLEKEVSNKNLNDNVIFTGYLDKKDVFTGYQIAKLMLFPSKTETQGLTVVESLLSGTPVIGLNQLGVKNVIGDNLGGIVTKESIEEYTDACLSLLNDKIKYEEYVEKAIKRGKEFSVNKSGKLLIDAYNSILDETKK